MATEDEVKQALLTAIAANAEAAIREQDSTRAERRGNAARHLAEALAWVDYPNQPH